MVALKVNKQLIDTPALVIDRSQLIENICNMQAYANAAGVAVRCVRDKNQES